ncbi:hypothetical protein CHARACLAT_009783 [Characodon lateralis]|uniref:Uncharacterized protein n=1 Tax=Characodon lateralis TaxID=208331 RepID=A0ABU7EVK3_9TELE|nr:hypothetical protein [Characodon lateralis]
MKAGSGTGTSRLHGRVTDGVQKCRSLKGRQVSLGEAESMESNGCRQSLTGNLGKEGEVRIEAVPGATWTHPLIAAPPIPLWSSTSMA